jgi:hypothetical protein
LIFFVDGGEIQKSNVISVTLPLERSIKGALDDGYFAYITTNTETAPSDIRLESKLKVLYNTRKCLISF